jgi:hypothetical protein
MAKPKRRVREEERRLRSMEYFTKNRALFDRERTMRELRAARLQADQLENYLASLNSAYRGAADYQRRIQDMVKRTYGEKKADVTPGMPAQADALRYFPTSYPNIRRVAGG